MECLPQREAGIDPETFGPREIAGIQAKNRLRVAGDIKETVKIEISPLSPATVAHRFEAASPNETGTRDTPENHGPCDLCLEAKPDIGFISVLQGFP